MCGEECVGRVCTRGERGGLAAVGQSPTGRILGKPSREGERAREEVEERVEERGEEGP